MRGLFITGNDTGAGKTYVSCQLIAELRRRELSVIPRKPVESGCETHDGKLFPADASSLLTASQSSQTLEQVCPFRFTPAISPQLAARHAGKPLQLKQLLEACTRDTSETDFLVVEGAGGFYSPICEGKLNADLAQALGLPVVIVVDDRLGAVNQALLSIAAVKQRQLNIRCVILNQTSGQSHPALMDNLSELHSLVDDIPVISLTYQQSLSPDQLNTCLN